MATKIEWCEETWNPLTGCSPVSEGCEHCYARRMAQRLKGRYGYPQDDPFRVRWQGDRYIQRKQCTVLEEPLKWKKPRHIFVVSMGDLFHPDIPWSRIVELFHVMELCSWHTFLILTKRPTNMKTFIKTEKTIADIMPDNIYLGVTAENQQRADERIPILLQIPAAKHFVSIEPMLGPVNLHLGHTQSDVVWRRIHGGNYQREFIDWIIVSGESSPGARPMHPDWPRSVRNQCQEAGVPFFFKQWGEWIMFRESGLIKYPPTCKTIEVEQYSDPMQCKKITLCRIGKKAAGRLLDGQEWNERP